MQRPGRTMRAVGPLLLLLVLVSQAVASVCLSAEPQTRQSARRQVIVRLPTATPAASGELIVEPSVEVVAPPEGTPHAQVPGGVSGRAAMRSMLQRPGDVDRGAFRFGETGDFLRSADSPGSLPLNAMRQQADDPPALEWEPAPWGQPIDEIPVNGQWNGFFEPQPYAEPDPLPEMPAEPLFETLIVEDHDAHCPHCRHAHCFNECGFWGKLFSFYTPPSGDIGIGHERVMLAPFAIEPTQPFNNVRVRFDSAYNMKVPDRAEYFWSRPGTGPPLPERSVDYQELRFRFESGGARFSALTEIPVRMVNPDVNDNTAGLGNINLGTKLLLVDGRDWQLTHIFRTYLKTGSASRGTAFGHMALEPGALVRYRWSPATYIHGQFTFLIPLGADSDHSGEVISYGVGLSHILYETDTFAILPTFEVVGWSVLDGQKTIPGQGVVPVDGEHFVNFHTGARFVLGAPGDLGLFELGVNGAFRTGARGWYDQLFRLDLRWSY